VADVGHREQAQLRRGQLDGEREPVEPVADRGHVGRGGVVDGERGLHGPGPLDEQGPGVGGQQQLGPVGGPGGQGERPDLVLVLAEQAQHGPGGHQHLHPGRGREQLADEARPGHHLLEVVQHEQAGAVAEVVADDRGGVAAGDVVQVEGVGDGGGDPGRVAHRGQGDEVDAVREPGQQAAGGLQREARLARPAGAGEGDQPHVVVAEQLGDRAQVRLAPDERGGDRRQVGHRRQAARGPVVLRDPRPGQLVEPLRPLQVLQPVPAEVLEGQPGRVGRRAPGLVGDEDLAAVGGRADPGHPVQVEPDVVVLDHRRGAGVHAHAHAQLDPARPGLAGQPGLRLGRGGDGRGGVGERDEAGVALGAELTAAMVGDGGTQDHPVRRQDLAVVIGQGLEQPRRALDVGEQQRHRTGR
jgi:hypothetical protein